MKHFLSILLFACLLPTLTPAQSPREAGFPIVTNFAPKDYNGRGQNWAIVQDSSGLLYVGNGGGLLEYDGVTWRKNSLPNQSTVRSLALGDNHKIYAGSNVDLGYFQPDGQGKLIFHSLKTYLPEDKQDFARVEETYFIEGKVYSHTGKYVFIWDTKKQAFNILESGPGFEILFQIGKTIYITERGKGLGSIIDGTFSLLKGGEIFAEDPVDVMLPFPDEAGKILVVSRNQGMFVYDGEAFVPFRSQADAFLKENRIYSGTLLADGNILLGTISGGAVVINTKGELLNSYNQSNGLRDNSILYPFQDRSGGLWLATANGISHVAYTAPMHWFDTRSGLTSPINDLIRHRGTLYAATETGIFALDSQTAQFKKLQGVNSQAWQFLVAGEELLVAINDGLMQVEKDRLIPVRPNNDGKNNPYVITPSIHHPERIYVGTGSGLWALRKSGKDLIDEGRLADIQGQPNSLTENEDGSLWMGTWSSGLFRISFSKGDQEKLLSENTVIERFDATHGLQEGRVYVSDISENIYFNTRDSLYVFQESSKHFVADTSHALIRDFYAFASGMKEYKKVYQDKLGNVWFFTKGKIAMRIEKLDGTYDWMTTPFNRIADIASPYYSEENGIVWMETNEGLIRFELEKAKAVPVDYQALIRQVTIAGDSVLYFGSMANQPSVPNIAFASNSLRFDFGAASFEDRTKLRFATYLQGFDPDNDRGWTAWTNEPFKEYTNLAPGSYTFQVKAIDLNGTESITASYSFEILPPWWRTWLAYALFALLFLGAGYAILRWRTKALQKEKEVLEEKVVNRTAELKQSLENLKSTQAQLIQSEKMASLGELTAGIAHEIQNPLNFVNNFSEVSNELIAEVLEERKKEKGARDEGLEEEILGDIKENLTKINHHGQRASSIVKGMLEHSRKSSGTKEPTDINALCDEYLRLTFNAFKSKEKDFNVTMETHFDPTLPKIDIISQDIGRVVLNILNNAFYAVAERSKKGESGYEPTVSVSTKRVDTPSGARGTSGKTESIQISISDNGSGIPTHIKDKIFQPFFTTKSTGQGTGLGLSLDYDIGKAHGGQLKVESKEGEETKFIILLPTLTI